MDKKAILLDLDYTLIDASDGIYLCIKYALEKMGYPVPDYEKSVSTIGLAMDEKFKALTSEIAPEKIKVFEQLFLEQAPNVLIKNTKLLKDTLPFLTQAKEEGYRLGLVTSKYRRSLNEVINKFKLDQYLDFHIAGDEVMNPKPHPMSLTKAVTTLSLTEPEALYIGDSVVDAEAASRANLDFIAVLTGKTKKEAFLEHPHIAVLKDLTTVIDTINIHRKV